MMPRKTFSPEQEALIRKIYLEHKSNKKLAQDILSKEYKVSTRTIRKWANRLGLHGEDQEILDIAKNKKINSKVTFFTWAQESTPVHANFLKNMEAYAEKHDAEIGVIAGRYQNPTSIFKDQKDKSWWDKSIIKYLTLNRHNVHKNVSVLADVKVLPTAMNPMSGFDGFEGEVSIIIGHPRVQMKVVPALEGYTKKEIWTTGSCTVDNYTDSKAGKKGEFHHTLGFVIVESDGDNFHIRQVTADDNGNFIDIVFSVEDGIVTRDYSAISVYACGDKHFGEEDPEMEKVSKQMITKLKPRYVRLDDIFNGHSISHHERRDPIKMYERYINNESTLKHEYDQLKKHLKWYSDKDFDVIIPRCNHDDFLDRYIGSQDWKKDIPNAMEYMDGATILMKGLAPKGLIPYYIGQWYPKMITLGTDESFIVDEWEHSVHGHIGANGSRGSVVQYRKFSVKMVTNHTHSPSRYDGVVTGGTNTLLRPGYAIGPSSWMHCDTITHRNGKAQHLMFHNYKCTTFKL